MKGKPTPIATCLFSFTFTAINGYLQGRYLSHYLSYDMWWFLDPRFVAGQLIFLFGMAANIHSDTVLKNLRKPGEKGYKIPYGQYRTKPLGIAIFTAYDCVGGMFELVSGANYFSESLEWFGYAVATWSWPGFVMFAFTTMFLGSRALHHHKYAKNKTKKTTPLPPPQGLNGSPSLATS